MVASVSLRALPPRKTTGLREFVYGSRSRTNALHKPLQRRGSRKAQPALAEEQTKSEEINEVELARELKGASVVLEMLAEFFLDISDTSTSTLCLFNSDRARIAGTRRRWKLCCCFQGGEPGKFRRCGERRRLVAG